jgi:hypothetical protein
MKHPKVISVMFLAGAIAGATFVWAQTADKKDADSPAQAKLAAAQEIFKLDDKRRAAGMLGDEEGIEFQHTWSVRLMDAEREAADATPDARRQAAQRHLDRMKARAKIAENLYSLGHASKVDVLASHYFVAEAERWAQEPDRKP